MLLPLAALLIAAERPSGNGDPIGIATLDRDGRLTLRLRSVECDGMIAEGLVTVRPGEADYARTLRWVGRIRRGETKPIVARDLEPCPAMPGARR